MGITTTTNVRRQSIDILRGLIMILMAIDHVRVYSGVPAGDPDPGIFFTRWITHFCAPGFAFFAGTSAFFYAVKVNDKRKLTRYLITRGLLLVLLEFTLIRFCWTFNFDYSDFVLAGVIWMLGCCMVLLAAFVWMRAAIAGVIGLLIIFFQQSFQYVPSIFPASTREAFGRFWEFIYPSGYQGPEGIYILYVLVPWIGVMAAGYGFGAIVNLPAEKRKKICLWIGLSAILLFLVIGSVIALRKPASPDQPAFIFRLLNQNKYPASQLYLLMTLGPLIALVPYAERMRGRLADFFGVFGRVPLFYYLLHIPLIHISAFILNLLRDGSWHQEWYRTAPFVSIPPGERWSLAMLYLVFLADVILLYFACRWYAGYKSKHPEKNWLKYL